MDRRWLYRGLVSVSLGFLSIGCFTTNQLMPSGMTSLLQTPPSGDPATTPGAPLTHSEELPRDQALKVCLSVAQRMDQAGNDEGALEQWEKVEKLDPKNLQAARRLAVLYDRRCDFPKAEAEYKRLAKAFPRDSDLFSDWGYSYYLRNKWDDAEAKLRQALQFNPKNERAQSNLGLVLGQRERYGEAFAAFKAAGLSDADVHCNMAFVYWTKGNLEQAKKVCRTARTLEPTCKKALDMLTQLEASPRSPVEKDKVQRTVSGRPADGRPRAATLSAEHWAAERAAAERTAAQMASSSNPGMGGMTPPPLPPMPGFGAASPEPTPLPQPVLRTSDGTAWVPVQPSGARPAANGGGPAASAPSAPGTVNWSSPR